MMNYPSWNTGFGFELPKRILMISTASLLDDGRYMKRKPRRYSGNSHQRRKQRRKVGS